MINHNHNFLIKSLLTLSLITFFFMLGSTAHASGFVTVTKSYSYTNRNHHSYLHIQKAKLPYSSKKNISINKSNIMSHTWEDYHERPDGTIIPGTTSKYLMKLRYITYYRLKPNKYGKKVFVRYHFSAKGISKMKFTIYLFTNDLGNGFLKTQNKHKLFQFLPHFDEDDWATVHQNILKGTKKIVHLNIDYTSKKSISSNSFKHASIKYGINGAGSQLFKY